MNTARWKYGAAVIAGIALVLAFFLVFGIPRSFESLSHRDDSAWQERNNPTTTTTISVPPPLNDAFAREFQGQLNTALAVLDRWDREEGRKWESFTLDMQYAYDPMAADPEGFGNVVPSVVECIERFRRLTGLWSSVYRGDLVDFTEAEVWSESTSRADRGAKYWDRVGTDSYALLHALDDELCKIDRSLLWTMNTQGYDHTAANCRFAVSWLMTKDKVRAPLSSAESDLDLAYSKWYLATDRAERPWRY